MAIIKYKNNPSIKAITERMEKLDKASHEETEKEVNNLKNQKSFTKIRNSSENYQEKCRHYFMFPIS